MLEAWNVVTAARTRGNVERLRAVYGRQVVVSRLGLFNLIHLDCPDRTEIRLREDAFDPRRALDESWPLWRKVTREGADVVFLGRKKRGNGAIGDIDLQPERALDGDRLGGGVGGVP